jgi:hypothetical protein
MYAPIEKRTPFLSIEESKQIIKEHNPLIIYCRPSYLSASPPKNKISEDYLKMLTLHWDPLQEKYDDYMNQMDFVTYDWRSLFFGSYLYDRVMHKVRKKIKEVES